MIVPVFAYCPSFTFCKKLERIKFRYEKDVEN